MENQVWEQICQTRLTIDQTDTLLELDRTETENYYDPLACFLLKRYHSQQRRLMIAVAGPPGVGKTAFTTLLVAVINAEAVRQGAEHEVAIQIQQDGWHYPNSYLTTHTLRRGNEEILLSQIKGKPETFDTTSAYTCLEKIRRGKPVSYPVYSRILHNPVPDAGKVASYNQVVVVEGNYLLLQREPWRRFLNLFDLRIFLTAPREALIEGLRQRHQRGGKSTAATDRQIQEVDLPNIDLVLENSAPGDIRVSKTDNTRISSVEYPSIDPET
jgi:hypothetical protein